MAGAEKTKIVYVVGAGLSAGLGFPTIGNLLPEMWKRLEAVGLSEDLADVIRFHHPSFNSALTETYPDIEQLLSKMMANVMLFKSSRTGIGNFTIDDLKDRMQRLLYEITRRFHELHAEALEEPPGWLLQLVDKMKVEEAQIISFNWDLILDQLLFGSQLSKTSYGLDDNFRGPRLIKPHGSLNWHKTSTGRFLKQQKQSSGVLRS